MRVVPLTRGYVALVDDEDYALVFATKWHVLRNVKRNTVYAVGRPCDGKGPKVLMHRFILGVTDKSVQVDHENQCGVDNRRSNLRKATQAQNEHNSCSHKDGTSKYKGVSLHRSSGRWRVKIRNTQVGYFTTEGEAARAYNVAAFEHFGQFAYLNHIGE